MINDYFMSLIMAGMCTGIGGCQKCYEFWNVPREDRDRCPYSVNDKERCEYLRAWVEEQRRINNHPLKECDAEQVFAQMFEEKYERE